MKTGLSTLCTHPWGSLTHLDLRSCALGYMSMQHMAEALGRYPAPLRILHLSHNPLGAQAGVHLGAILQHASSLTQLHLTGCGLEDVGVQGLVPGVAMHDGLELLDLTSNEFGGPGRCRYQHSIDFIKTHTWRAQQSK
jgi:Ran GTPase-activating protein (RanGAP) involved in mRNA processing and transport